MSRSTPNARLVHVEITGEPSRGRFALQAPGPPPPKREAGARGGLCLRVLLVQRVAAARGLELYPADSSIGSWVPKMPNPAGNKLERNTVSKAGHADAGRSSNFLLRGWKERRPGQLPTSSGEANPASGCKRIRRVIQSQGQQVYPSVWEVLDLCWHMEN